jgi:2-amino-4-hydroxy-6-hydroxymethyldihydropteridine diphosphokinase
VILVAIGSNLPAPDGTGSLALCRLAADALDGSCGLRLAARSNWYRTRPVPPSDQPWYINGIVRLEGEAEPAALLAALHGIETLAGRTRGVRNAARTLDLDLIELNGLVRAAPDPVLPHPRAHLRGFVLRPLLDVAPDWRHPVLGAGAAALLAGLRDAEAGLPDAEPVPIGLLGQEG